FNCQISFMDNSFHYDTVLSKELADTVSSLSSIQFNNTVKFYYNDISFDFIFSSCSFYDSLIYYNINYNRQIPNSLTFQKCNIRNLFFNTIDRPDQDGDGSHFNHEFNGDLIFNNCRIIQKLDLSGCSFLNGGKIKLNNTFLPDTVDFSNVVLTTV